MPKFRSNSNNSSVFGKIISDVGELFSDTNKLEEGGVPEEGTDGEGYGELTLDKDDDELLNMAKRWKKDYESYKGKIEKRQKQNLKMWLGKDQDINDNIIFMATETLLPTLTRQVPTPVVIGPNEQEGYDLAEKVQKMLVYISDIEKVKVKNKKVVRNWMINLLGIAKIGWDYQKDEIKYQAIDTKNIILDKSATFEVCEYQGDYIGHVRTERAKNLMERFPDKKEEIEKKLSSKKKVNQKVKYTEWWTDEMLFYTFDGMVLGKYKNPHWNYDGKEVVVDKFGNEVEREVRGSNHFPHPQMPFIFLPVFNMGDGPFDSTSLIEQVAKLQGLVNKRAKQIDDNVDDMNNGWIVSSEFSKEQTSAMVKSIRNGGVVRAPTEDISRSVQRIQPTPLPSLVFNDMQDKRNEIQNLMGVRGSTPQGILSERTVQGKIEIKGQDIDRSVGITDYVEQFSDRVFNWMVQMMYVYYDQEHVARIIGDENATEYFTLKREDLFGKQMLVSVKEGSLIPKDPLTRRNEAVDLAQAGLIDPLTMFERLDYPDPKEAAKRLMQSQQNAQEYMIENELIEPPEPAPKQQAPQQQQPQPQQQPQQQPPDQGLGMLQALQQDQ